MAHEAAALLDLVDVLVCPPVRGPLPHVADHVLVAELGGGELRDGPRPAPPVRLRVVGGEGPGPDVGAVLATRQPLEEDKYFLIPQVQVSAPCCPRGRACPPCPPCTPSPTPPPWAAACPPTRRRPPRRSRRREPRTLRKHHLKCIVHTDYLVLLTTGWDARLARSESGPSGWRQSAPVT